jgi:hypothetical protein
MRHHLRRLVLAITATCLLVTAVGAAPALATDTYEPNNDAAHATPVVNPGNYVSYISTINDLDVYKLHLTPGNIMFTVTAPTSAMNMYLYLYDSDLATATYPSYIASANANGDGFAERLSYSITAEGDYYVVAGAYSHGFSVDQSYTLTVDGMNLTKFPVQARLKVPSDVDPSGSATIWLGLYSNDIALPGLPMLLQSSTDGASGWSTVATITSNTYMLTTTVSPPRDTWYKVVFAGDLIHQSATSAAQKLAVGPPDTTPPITTASGADSRWHRTSVTITLSASDRSGGSGMSGGQAGTEYRVDGGGWTTGMSCTVEAPADHSGDGVHRVSYRSTDAAGNTEAAKSVTVKIDTLGPATKAATAQGRKGRALSLRYMIADAQSPQATAIRLVVMNARGTVVTTISLGAKPTATWYSVSWTPKTKGSYRYAVHATDLAGNTESRAGSAAVSVK